VREHFVFNTGELPVLPEKVSPSQHTLSFWEEVLMYLSANFQMLNIKNSIDTETFLYTLLE
jgi:hypothetical protein